MAPILGCIADDFTGATDLANVLVRGGMRTVQLLGVPEKNDSIPEADAVVIALKSRTSPRDAAVRDSLIALGRLRKAGARQFFFKYCSTFDSTDAGNIGPVIDALMNGLGTAFTIACPAFPEAGRTIYMGHLFVGDQLLSDSPMRHHPLTPMTDSNLVAVLGRQTKHGVGLVRHSEVAAGAGAILTACEALKAAGKSIAIVDALNNRHLHTIGEALGGFHLITGGSGIALGLPQTYRAVGLLGEADAAEDVPAVPGPELVLSGSCSPATLEQVAAFSRRRPHYRLDPVRLSDDPTAVDEAIAWAREAIAAGPALVFASAAPEDVRAAQARLGREAAGAAVEQAMARIARALVDAGTRRLVVAGGETAGAVVGALGVRGLRIGSQIDPGVPGTVTIGEPALALALKSGNFGAPDFFEKALRSMP